MNRIGKLAVIGVIAASSIAVPAIAGQDEYGYPHRSGDAHAYRGPDQDRYSNGDRERRDDDRRDREYRNDGYYGGPGAYGYAYAPGPVYEPAPAYPPAYGGAYDPDYGRTHHGRDAAIILGGAAAGAAIGGAAGHGQGAAIGALIGGIAGAVTSATVDHHGHDDGR